MSAKVKKSKSRQKSKTLKNLEKIKDLSIRSSTPDLSFLFDIQSILKDTPHSHKLSVTLKNQPIKGNSLFATKPIQKGDIIAYYKIKVFGLADLPPINSAHYTKKQLKQICDELKLTCPEDASVCQLKEIIVSNMTDKTLNGKGVMYTFKDMYTISVTNKNDRDYEKLIGDLYKGSIPSPKNNIPYWGYFANEPFYGTERANAEIDFQLSENFAKKGRSTLKEGDTLTYALIATRDIHPGEEIMWHYGKDYDRSYKVGEC